MGDLVNLNKYRKERRRESASRQAAANRVKFGRPKAETRQDDAEAERRRRELEDKKLD
ncbi:MAG: DUF4169 family protein [Dongiaceae bacterium]